MPKLTKILLFLVLIFLSVGASSQNILGGKFYIIGESQTIYQNGNFVTMDVDLGLELYGECSNTPNPSAQFPATISIAIYSNATGKLSYSNNNGTIKLVEVKTFSGGKLPECVVNAGTNCYNRAIYAIPNIRLPTDRAGYTVIYEACCRTADVTNIRGNQGYTISSMLLSVYPAVHIYPVDNFEDNNNIVLCANSPFSLVFPSRYYDFAGVRYSYHLVPAYGSSIAVNNQVDTMPSLPYMPLVYDTSKGFNGFFPLGKSVTVDTLTGALSGIAPAPGNYLVKEEIHEYIEGDNNTGPMLLIAEKQFVLKVRSCKFDGALLDPVRTNCDSLTVAFKNQMTNPSIATWQWQFFRGNTVVGSSSDSTTIFQFQDTGVYTIKLKVASAAGCADSATQQLRLYPFLKAGFKISGNCIRFPYVFTDTSSTTLGTIKTRLWDLGDETTTADTSVAASQAYTYATQSKKTVQLTVTNTNGCVAVVKKILNVSDKPDLMLSTKDTLICSIDTLQLHADGQGIINWSPAYNIIAAQTASPLVYPKHTTSYIADINSNGCVNSDTVVVNVLDFIIVNAGLDISLCLGDSVRINTNSQALSYQWSPAIGLNSDTAKSPVITLISSMEYFVTANLGKCQAKDTLLIKVFPYPLVNAGDDTLSCSGARTILQGNTNATDYFWTPSVSLFNTGSLNPAAIPIATTKYVLTGYNKEGCTNPVSDTILVTVIPNKITVDAGRDTSVVVGQPLQLHATATDSINYLWTPSSGLSDPTILNPVAILNGIYDSIKYTITATSGVCKTQDDVVIKIFKGKPDIYVPSAFTPNGDGRNDVLHPVPVGIKTFLSFDIFQRWGGQLFHTTDFYKGWDGKVNGKDQSNGTYVYIARGIDYLGNYIERTGTVTIIR